MAETEWSLLGMSLDAGENDLQQPLEAITVVKGLDSNDQIAWWIARTEDLNDMETEGMLRWALRNIQAQ
jgi:hypothetical protein